MWFYRAFLFITFIGLCALKAMSTEVVIMDYDSIDYDEANIYTFGEERDPCESHRYTWEY